MREAAKDYKNYMIEKGIAKSDEAVDGKIEASQSNETVFVNVEEVIPVQQNEDADEQQVDNKNIESEAERERRTDEAEEQKDESDDETTVCESEKGDLTVSTPEQEHGYLRYLFLTKLFA